MNLQKVDKITRLEQELHMEDKRYLQILGRPEKTLIKMGNPDVLIAIYMNIQQRNAKSQRKNGIQGNATNVTKQDITKDCKLGQKIKNHSIQEETDDKKDDKQKGFGEGPKQVWYKGSLYLILKINILIQTNGTIKKESSMCRQISRQQMERNYGYKYQWV